MRNREWIYALITFVIWAGTIVGVLALLNLFAPAVLGDF